MRDAVWLLDAAVNRFAIKRGRAKRSYIRIRNVDLVHAAQCFIPYAQPYVLEVHDFPNAFGLASSFRQLEDERFMKNVHAQLVAPHLKKIMPISAEIARDLSELFADPEIDEKIEVVPPAYHEIPSIDRSGRDSVTLMFVGNRFLLKGGREMLETFRLLSRRYAGRVKLNMVCVGIPDEYRLLAAELSGLNLLPKMTAWTRGRRLLSRVRGPLPLILSGQQMDALFRDADIFVHPVFDDSFLAPLEAMAYGLPIVATRTPATIELVRHGHTGLLVDTPINWAWRGSNPTWRDASEFTAVIQNQQWTQTVSDLVGAVSNLIESPTERRRLGENARAEVVNGKFSIERRNAKLRAIYAEALMGQIT